MRERKRILGNLEDAYREGFRRAEGDGDDAAMAQLDFEFQRDQLFLEVVLDVRELLSTMDPGGAPEVKTTSLLEKAQAIRRLTRLR